MQVFYNSEKDASAAGYLDYTSEKHMNRKGQIYPYTGLRGDAKALYQVR